MPSLTPSSFVSLPTENVEPPSSWKFNQVHHSANYSLQTLNLPTPSGRSEPCLINLSPGNSPVQYHLQSGVTMLGTGEGCVKRPDIVLQGPGVAPQHCFIERLDRQEEVILHPISDLTTVHGNKIVGPTPLNHGNLIRVGNVNLLQFQKFNNFQSNSRAGTTLQSQLTPSRLNPLTECPYAVVVKQKGTTSNLNFVGDVNKTSSYTMDKSVSSPTPPINECHSNNNSLDNTERQRHPFWRQDPVDDDYYDNGLPVDSESHPNYGDGLESKNFGDKVACFEFLATNSTNELELNQQHVRFPLSQTVPVQRSPPKSNSFPKSMSSSVLENKRRRPSPYFCRFGTNSEFKYFSDENRTLSADSNANHILQSSEAVPTLGYRRTHSVSYASSSPFEGIPLIRSNTIDDSKLSANPFSSITQSSQSSNSFSLQSSPSPDSVYSSHSSDGSFTSYNFRSTSVDPRNAPREHKNSTSFTLFEEGLDLNILRQTTPDERNFSSQTIPSPEETSTLDEVLAICEEYEQQIAREIERRHSCDHQTQAMTNEGSQKSDDFSRSPQFVTAKNSHGNGTPDESGLRGHGTLDQRRLILSDVRRNRERRAEFNDRGGFQSHFSLPCDNSTKESTTSSQSFDLGLFRLNQYPYENVCIDDLEQCTRVTSLTQTLIPQESLDCPRPAKLVTNHFQNGHGIESPPKSKLSVSFSPSVEEYNVDDYIPRVSSASSSPKTNTELTSRLKTSPTSNMPIVKTVATKVEVHTESVPSDGIDTLSNWDTKHLGPSVSTPRPILVIQEPCQVVESQATADVIQFAKVIEVDTDSTPLPLSPYKAEDQIPRLKAQLRDLEQLEMEALGEIEMEKALLVGEEQSMEAQLLSSKLHFEEMRNRLCQLDAGIRLWKVASSQELSAMKRKLSGCERNLQRLEKMHEDFCGTTDEETALLEKLKYQHELIEVERKVYEDAEFQQMEETASKESQRDELTKLFGETKRKLSLKQTELDQLRNQNRTSLAASIKEIQKLESQRQQLIVQLECHELARSDSLTIPESSYCSSNSDSDEVLGKNSDLEEKLKSLTILAAAADDAMTIEMIKSNSPIDPKLGIRGAKATETLREIEKYRECLLNEQGVQMLEEERLRVKELQKRVQTAVREEWEAARQNRNNQCNSLNSVGSEESSQTISDTPTDSGSSDDGPDKGRILSFGKTELRLEGNSSSPEEPAFELCQQMRHRQKDLSQTSSDDTPRPLSDGSAYDNSSTIVTLRDKHSLQNNRPLTRYLPVRGDGDHFDLRGHIESSGHQLSLCPHLILTSTIAKGSLLKLGNRFHNWNKRWFVFDRETRTLSYYIDKTQKKPRGGIHFQAIQEVYVDHLQSVKSPAPKLTFCVKTYNRIFHFVAPSPEAMRIWVDVIFTGAEGYQEFKSTT